MAFVRGTRREPGLNPEDPGPRLNLAYCEQSPNIRAMERILHVLTGPTAVGKTQWALQWAEAYGAEIVSADSLLFYRGMDIGTAKPSAAERARVPHHLIDICAVPERMDVTDYVSKSRAACEDIRVRSRRVLVCGGSGFYLKAFFAPVADDVAVPAEVRTTVATRLERDGLAALVAELLQLNPQGLGSLDVYNPRRVVRALERCLASQRTLAQLTDAFARQPAPFAGWNVRLVLLDRPRAELDSRIEARVRAMMTAGLIDEVRRLLADGLKQNPSAARAIGYRETIDFLEGRLAADKLAAAIIHNTRALVRKQSTWFRTQLPPHRVLAADDLTVDSLFPETSAAGTQR